jgi:ketosteroid isomerase-like protein
MTANATNLDLVRTAFAAFERRDLAGLQAQCTTDVRFVSQTARVGAMGEDYVGHQGLQYYFRDTESIWETITLQPEDFREHGADLVIVTGRVRAWGSGRVVDGSASWLFRVSRGRIAEIRAYDTLTAADDAAAVMSAEDR